MKTSEEIILFVFVICERNYIHYIPELRVDLMVSYFVWINSHHSPIPKSFPWQIDKNSKLI